MTTKGYSPIPDEEPLDTSNLPKGHVVAVGHDTANPGTVAILVCVHAAAKAQVVVALDSDDIEALVSERAKTLS